MKRILRISGWIGLLLCAAGMVTAQAQNTYVTFSVDMSSNLVAGTFDPAVPAYVGGIPYGGTGTDTVYARGVFDGWATMASTMLPLIQIGNSAVFTNTTDDNAAEDQSDGNMNWIYAAYENGVFLDEYTSDFANRMAYLPKGNNATLVLPTAYFGDDGPAVTNEITFQVDMTAEIQLGNFHPGSGDYVGVAGSYEGFVLPPNTPSPYLLALTNNPNILVTNNDFDPPLVESNVWMGSGPIWTDSAEPLATVNCGQQFKYVILPEGNWDSPQYPNLDPDSGNRFYTMSGDQVLPLVNFSDVVPVPSPATVNMSVDLSVIAQYDTNFEPNSVTVDGFTFNGWSGPAAMTNSQSAANTNLYMATSQLSEGIPHFVQFRYTNTCIRGLVYDHSQDGGPDPANNVNFRHIIYVPISRGPVTTNFTFFFNDVSTNDVLTVPTPVLFTVNMTGAVGTDGRVFVPGADDLYINGMFVFPMSEPVGGVQQNWYAWSGGANPVGAPAGFQMQQVGSSAIYTNIAIVPAGTPVGLSYQYGIDINGLDGGPAQDEAFPGSNHFRVVRTQNVGANPYVLATDTFTNTPYQEPFFSNGNIAGYGSPAGGDLTVGTPVAGKVPVSWLGRPGARLQSASVLAGPWTNNPVTDGHNWTAGYRSTNGLVSVTNWPSSGVTFFRMVKP
jgi:hypothetical protein